MSSSISAVSAVPASLGATTSSGSTGFPDPASLSNPSTHAHRHHHHQPDATDGQGGGTLTAGSSQAQGGGGLLSADLTQMLQSYAAINRTS